MRPPLPIGTVLQNRYRILSVLGQGGFGRTYLAEDQGRFNERCALKELTPAQGGGAYALDKSKELFQREAQTLYQIQHPQIPQFRATFEQDQRLFLVQDYVEGQTYRALLDQRHLQGVAFSEAEALQLIRQLLPVLGYLHAKGIIHRDITPDNIIHRQSDNKPVLIDFGVVKELATRLQAGGTIPQHTTVGKLGYAPAEQIQTGRAYPSSDLYSLAVTVVVLLTGREPQELLDDSTMTWYWQRWVMVNPGLAQVINRMLSYRPGDRYQSASEVSQAIEQLSAPPPPPSVAPLPTPSVSPQTAPPPHPDLSQLPTMAVGRRGPVTQPVRPGRDAPVIESPRSSVWDDPWAVVLIGLALVVLTGFGTWLVVRTVMTNQAQVPPPLPTVTPSPTITPSPSPTDTPQPPQPISYSQRLNLTPGASISRSGKLAANETINYLVPGDQGETLNSVIEGEGVLMTVLGPNREPVDERSRRVSFWQGALPYTGDYTLQLRPVEGLETGSYKLTVSLASPPTPSPSPTPSPTEPPRVDVETVEFPAGETRTEVSDLIRGNVIKRYLVNAEAGKLLSAEIIDGRATLDIRNPDGQVIDNASGIVVWQSRVDTGGTYRIDVVAPPRTRFVLRLGVQD